MNATEAFLGHESLERSLLDMAAAGRLPHALILAGESGIGKATLATRLASYLLSLPDEKQPGTLAISPASITARQIAAGSHPGLLTIQRRLDETSGKPQKEIVVEDVRRIAPALRLTAAEGGWRVAIIDEASTLNRSGQNALLKILEEPPPRSLLILVADRPGLLLPTIHSRCRLLRLAPLSQAVIGKLLEHKLPDLSRADRIALATLAEGSIGRALRLHEEEGLVLFREILELAENLPKLDWPKVHSFSERLASPSADSSYRLFTEFLPQWLTRLVKSSFRSEADLSPAEAKIRHRLAGLTTLDRWVDACDKISDRLQLTDHANLDRKLAVWAAYKAMEEAVS